MNLIIDQGNTRVKLALFDDHKLIRQSITDNLSISAIRHFIESSKLSGIILSSVKTVSSKELQEIKKLPTHFVELSHTTRLPFVLSYQTPETLGRDRIAAVAGAYFEHPKQNILIIDLGTAITFDLIDAQGNYRGGNIAPGLEMRLNALNHYTDKLPLIDKKGETALIGYNTETAIRSGVVNGIVFEIEGYIKHLSLDYPELLIFLTGGDTFYFDKRLKNIIFADEYLVLKGLNRILQYNAQ